MAQDRLDLKPYMGHKLTVIAWLWARTVKSPNPAFSHVDVPLASTFMLSTKPGNEAYLEPIIEGDSYHFKVKKGKPTDTEQASRGTKLARANFVCLMSGTPITGDYIKAEGKAGRMGTRMMAIVTESDHGRIYMPPTPVMESVAQSAKPGWTPEIEISGSTQYIGVKPYGMERFSQLFTNRQLLALTTFSDLVQEAREKLLADVLDNNISQAVDGPKYADAVSVYLAFCLDKNTLTNTTLATWQKDPDRLTQAFSRQAIAMTWDFAEANPLSDAGGGFIITADAVSKVLLRLPENCTKAEVFQHNASTVDIHNRIVSTDPPYFDNVPYADLSDYFYVWLRRSLKATFPELFATLAVPKAAELVAFAYRHGNKIEAEAFFLKGMTQAMQRLAEESHPAFPVTIYYAFRQAETDDDDGTASTGWDTFLDAVIRAGFTISGTWPMRTEYTGNLKTKRNALASSIVIVCRTRASGAPTATRRDFISALQVELPIALLHLQRSNTAPVDLAQAAIGPGMAVYTRYAKVLDAEGTPLPVRAALALINQTLDEALAEQEGDFDADSRWALAWFEQSGFSEGDYGVAETLSKAKNTSVAGMVEAGILTSSRGKVRLLRPDELPADWDPTTDKRLSGWEAVHQLVRALESGGDQAAADLVAKLGSQAEAARELCYRLYTVSERKKRAADALSYNALVQSWPEITRLAREGGTPRTQQPTLFQEDEE